MINDWINVHNHIIVMNQSILSNIYLILLICSVIINQRIISEINNVNQCGLSYRQVMKVLSQPIQPVQQIQQDQIQPVQLPQFGLYEKNRNYIDMIFMYRIWLWRYLLSYSFQ